jgi:hypothetical protein
MPTLVKILDDPIPMALEQGAAVNPQSRPVASWSEDDLRRVMASPVYWQPSHRGRARAHAMVREWFEHAEASAAGRADASGRSVPEPGAAAEPAGEAARCRCAAIPAKAARSRSRRTAAPGRPREGGSFRPRSARGPNECMVRPGLHAMPFGTKRTWRGRSCPRPRTNPVTLGR